MINDPRDMWWVCAWFNCPQLHQEATVNETSPGSQRSTFVKQLKLGKVALRHDQPRMLKARLKYCSHIFSLSFSSLSVFASIYKDWHGPVKEPWKDRSMCSSQSICQWTVTNTIPRRGGSSMPWTLLRLKIQGILQGYQPSMTLVRWNFQIWAWCSSQFLL